MLKKMGTKSGIPINLALRRLRYEGPMGLGHLRLHTEFQMSLGYKVIPCFKKSKRE